MASIPTKNCPKPICRLQNKVIDLEVAASTPSPTIDPSVHTILIGHSMGGIVAAETLLAIASESPIPSSSPESSTLNNSTDPLPSTAAHSDPATTPENHSSFMFPCISGLLAFDTPYLGICPGVIAHGAETHYKTASTFYSGLSEVAGVFGWGGAAASSSSSTSKSAPTTPNPAKNSDDKVAAQGAEAMTASMTASSQDAAATPTWQRWGKYAMFAGAAGAVAAGGAAAYLKRDRITEGWSWMGSHLEFVGCLAKGEELKSRLDRVVALNKERGIGFADLVTVLGKSASSTVGSGKPPTQLAGGFVEIGGDSGERSVAASQRTFCTVPRSEKNRKHFEPSRNDIAKDETEAHMTMFERKANSGYFVLADRAKTLISEWVEPSDWYQSSEPLPKEEEETFEEGLMMDVDLGEGDEEDKKTWAGEEPVLVDRAP